MQKILITRTLPDAAMDEARAAFDVTMRPERTALSEAEAAQALRDYDGIVPTLGDGFSAGAFAQVAQPRCKVLANFGAGFNHIDVAAARAAGVAVTNTPGAVTDATADVGVMLILMSARRAGEGERLVRAGRWEGWHPVQMLGLHVTGKRLGIVGMGRIGQAIARRCHHGFGMSVAYTARSEKALDFPARMVASAEALASQVDVLVAAVPGGPETRHIISRAVLAAMPRHAHFVNIARGDVVDETALIETLEAGGIAGAGLDVYEHEPHVPDRLRALENVVLLPHLGTSALEVREAMARMALANLAAVLSGNTAPNPV